MSGRREEILDAALDIADEHGLDAVSMRALADRVGVTPMALYRHVKDKAALLDGMVGRLLATVLPTEPDQDSEPNRGSEPTQDSEPSKDSEPNQEQTWEERLTALAHAFREMTRRHPWAAHLLFSRPAITPDAVRAVDVIYVALIEAGVPEPQVPRLERLISTFVIGFAASEASGRFAPGSLDPRGRRGRLPDSELPGHGTLAPWLDLPVDLTAEFEADLEDIRRLVNAAAGRTG